MLTATDKYAKVNMQVNGTDQVSAYVFRTKNYGQFKRLVGNRIIPDIEKNHLIKQVKEKQLFRIMLVNEKMEVIDGQHYLDACKELNLPVDYVIINGYGIDEVITLNVNSKKWEKIDYIASYAERGNTDYKLLLNLSEKYKIPVRFLTVFFSDSGHIRKKIKDGSFSIKDYDALEERVSYYRQLLDLDKKTFAVRASILAVTKLSQKNGFNREHFLERVANPPRPIVKYRKTEDVLNEFISIYNHSLKTKRI